ncbi:MAG: molybdopterin molybdotransferase MoeA [Pontiellaceae bacterium]|nr:molybdopterin molybdotransferase MoeA [Pontiellaceae bacterium]
MIDIAKSQRLILEATPVLGRESVPLIDALKRVLAQDIVVTEDIPAANISALDGYAVQQASLRGISKQDPARLKIIGESPAGKPCDAVVGVDEAVRIMTGGMMPEGADTVIKTENTMEDGGYMICHSAQKRGSGIRVRGESLKKGEIALYTGDIIRPLEIGALAKLRHAYVYVYRKPLVAILATGDELTDFHEPATPWKTMCSNLYALAAQVIDAGAIPLCLGIVQDNLKSQQEVLSEALRADVIITSGGSSKGKYDLVHKAFAALGMKTKFSSIFVKPGKPTIFGTIKNSMIFGLPGNSTAAMLSFEQFIRPALLKMMGHPNVSSASCGNDDMQYQSALFSQIDSFNYEQGGNKEHQMPSLVPLGRTLPGNGSHLIKQKQGAKTAPDLLKPIAGKTFGVKIAAH